MVRHRSKMKCEKCNEHPAWHRTIDDEGNSTLQCGLCNHYQKPRVTQAKLNRIKEQNDRLNATVKWLLGE